VKHKARLITKVYVQQPWCDFDKVFALVACIESIRMSAMAARHRTDSRYQLVLWDVS
jgi:hypothetical protein